MNRCFEPQELTANIERDSESSHWRTRIEMTFCPQLRHPITAQRTTGLGLGQFAQFECPVSGNRAAPPQANPWRGRAIEVIFAAPASGGFVRTAEVDRFTGSVRYWGKQTFRTRTSKLQTCTAASRDKAVICYKCSNDCIEPKAVAFLVRPSSQ